MLQGQQDLEQAGRAGRRQRMADVRLERSDDALARPPAGLAPERLEAGDLDGVAARRAGRVAFDQVDVVRASSPPARRPPASPGAAPRSRGPSGRRATSLDRPMPAMTP